MGVVTITAPMVPHRTMMAAVTWATSLTLPPSITRPPRMPPMARIRPPMRRQIGFAAGFLCCLGGRVSHRFRPERRLFRSLLDIQPPQRALTGTGNDGPAKPDNPFDHFFRRFEHHNLLAGGQGHHRIRGNLHVLDEIRVQDQRGVIQACELDHVSVAVLLLIGNFPYIFRVIYRNINPANTLFFKKLTESGR